MTVISCTRCFCFEHDQTRISNGRNTLKPSYDANSSGAIPIGSIRWSESLQLSLVCVWIFNMLHLIGYFHVRITLLNIDALGMANLNWLDDLLWSFTLTWPLFALYLEIWPSNEWYLGSCTIFHFFCSRWFDLIERFRLIHIGNKPTTKLSFIT